MTPPPPSVPTDGYVRTTRTIWRKRAFPFPAKADGVGLRRKSIGLAPPLRPSHARSHRRAVGDASTGAYVEIIGGHRSILYVERGNPRSSRPVPCPALGGAQSRWRP